MSGWVEYCTSMRSKAKNDFEKDFWKLMVNAVSMFLKHGFYHLKCVIHIFNNVCIPKAFSFNLFSGLWKNNRKCS